MARVAHCSAAERVGLKNISLLHAGCEPMQSRRERPSTDCSRSTHDDSMGKMGKLKMPTALLLGGCGALFSSGFWDVSIRSGFNHHSLAIKDQ